MSWIYDDAHAAEHAQAHRPHCFWVIELELFSCSVLDLLHAANISDEDDQFSIQSAQDDEIEDDEIEDDSTPRQRRGRRASTGVGNSQVGGVYNSRRLFLAQQVAYQCDNESASYYAGKGRCPCAQWTCTEAKGCRWQQHDYLRGQ